MTNESATVLAALRKEVESVYHEADGSVWGMVYLDNARSGGLSRHQFAGYLSDLKSNGLYRQTYDPAFGEVKL